jgi:hypothetical protein
MRSPWQGLLQDQDLNKSSTGTLNLLDKPQHVLSSQQLQVPQ